MQPLVHLLLNFGIRLQRSCGRGGLPGPALRAFFDQMFHKVVGHQSTVFFGACVGILQCEPRRKIVLERRFRVIDGSGKFPAKTWRLHGGLWSCIGEMVGQRQRLFSLGIFVQRPALDHEMFEEPIAKIQLALVGVQIVIAPLFRIVEGFE